ncbi:MAG TPA: ferrous iron transporter B, partial [Chryseolinea sp.]|nr:ferrous iron transporter B [Chryseolinea sp.]
MTPPRRSRIVLVGNPNSGKSSLFNFLTGLNQKIGNFPGVTVDKRAGTTSLPDGGVAEVVDLPGIYSIYPRSLDERIVAEILLDHHSPAAPDKVVVIVDGTNLKRGLLLATQVIDLGVPAILAMNMMDLAVKAGISYDFAKLSERLGVPVVGINARKGVGLDDLKKQLTKSTEPARKEVFAIPREAIAPVAELRAQLGVDNDYEAYQFLEQPNSLSFLTLDKSGMVEGIRQRHHFFPGKFQGAETINRYAFIQQLLDEVTIKASNDSWRNQSRMLDRILLHKVWGYVIFFSILLLIFQSIFAWATVLQDFIDTTFAGLSVWVATHLPEGVLTDLLAEGIIPGIGGIVIFVPQIAILFAFISMLEESGYMARVVFLMDRIMRKFGLNGKSV